jgi:hypothetical protein
MARRLGIALAATLLAIADGAVEAVGSVGGSASLRFLTETP